MSGGGSGGGGFLIEALSRNDSLAQMVMVILLAIFIYRVTAAWSKPCHTLWFSGLFTLMPVVFLATRAPEVAVNPYVSTFALVAAGLLAAGFVSALDRTGKLAGYYLMWVAAWSIVYAYCLHYGPRQTEVFGGLSFAAIAVPSVGLLLLLPVKAYLSKKASVHSLWIPLGTALTTASGYVMWAVNAEKMVLEHTSIVTYTLLLAGLLSILLGFLLAKELMAVGKPAEGSG